VRLWRVFVDAFWTAFEEATGKAERRREMERLYLVQEMARARREVAEEAVRKAVRDALNRRESVRAELVDSALLNAKTDGRLH
jgi:hypothetical protein